MQDYRLDVLERVGVWGDMGNGYYRNPVLMADYSDPDVVRVGEDFYMVCSEFHFMGMPVLHSKDLVNWTIIGQVYDRLEMDSKYDSMEKYGKGSWAPSIRFHDGLFYVYFCTPDEGLYMSTAVNPAGPWAPLHEVARAYRWEDPCPFWDDDGQAYLGRSQCGAGPIILHRMTPDGKSLLDDGVTIYEGECAEGTKIYKRNGYYYLIIPEGTVPYGWQTAARSRNLYGPYERQVVLSQQDTWVNGPHQGGYVELENGEGWFLHFSHTGALGRIVHLQPVTWIEDWPLIGYSKNDRFPGKPVTVWKKPEVGSSHPICAPQTSDNFDSPQLGLQWQWNHNPDDRSWSLTERPGYLRLRTQPGIDLLRARNVLTQKIMGTSGVITIKLDTASMGFNQRAGVALMGGPETHQLYVENKGRKKGIVGILAGEAVQGPELIQTEVWFRITIQLCSQITFYYSLDGWNYQHFWRNAQVQNGYWKGARVALFTYEGQEGHVDIECFEYRHDGPGGQLEAE
ncbi:glycoside hydrolase family 43 protein [Paenibacillus roseipurpureus]|uniref:Glycoside hydrolase 43 family protein n=1 Tax=Paenibacillus roseopurpureus TaxID=2918901 RepID=A0AA96RLR3_9BACL|nr:glycoside hydrolase 43 family protein [Paenibacillus sp. MBLB1832]WNR45950.1 glycoside hydrolase 43 family protein [Paenibacillus sp. MBLB1832]